MKGAKELAKYCREEAERQFGYFGAEERRTALFGIAAHLDRLAAIDSAVTGEVGGIAKRCADLEVASIETEEQDEAFDRSKFLAPKDRATLLAIVQRQAGEMADLMRRPAESRALRAEIERDAARAEVERLKDLVDEFKAATMLDVNGDPDGVTPRLLEGHVTALRTEIDRLQSERAALAQENARLINEVGELHAKLAAPSVDMTPGMQPRAMRESAGCHAGTDGDCYWSECPQIMDGEPHKSGRSCPLCNSADDS